jgi:hypothetical protein
VLLTASAVASGGGASAATCNPAPTPSDRVPGVPIVAPACGFTALPGATAYSGILDGSAYRIEVPDHWNGSLVMYADGYAGTGTTVAVSNPQLRTWYVSHGYAWAASSYRQNGYDVGDGVEDTHDLMVHFSGLTQHEAPRETYMTASRWVGRSPRSRSSSTAASSPPPCRCAASWAPTTCSTTSSAPTRPPSR